MGDREAGGGAGFKKGEVPALLQGQEVPTVALGKAETPTLVPAQLGGRGRGESWDKGLSSVHSTTESWCGPQSHLAVAVSWAW